MSDLTKLTIVEARKKLDAREISAVDLASAYLDEIRKKDGEILAYREVYEDVLEQARMADERIAAGEVATASAGSREGGSEMLGIPIAVKDIILVKGKKATAGSKILEGYVAPYDSSVISSLKKSGAVFLGRTNQDEFAMGSSGETSAYATSRNPHDLSRVPGGSSSGSAAAVAGNMAIASLGTDTGGSIRQPASLCGIVGIKPTYGTVSRYGIIALASSLDQVGPFARTVADAEIIFKVISGYDPKDSTNVPIEKRIKPNLPKNGKRLGVPRSLMREGLDKEVAENFEATLSLLAKKGYEIVDVELPNLHYSLPAYYIIQPAEASANLARFDGMKYGLSVPSASLIDVYKKTRGEGFGREVRRRILLGTYVLSSGYHDAYYGKACAVRELIKSDFVRVFREVDAIVTPTAPSPAFKVGEKMDDPVAMYLQDIFTVSGNIAGIPGISVPSGTVSVEGKDLPLGFQIFGPWFGEEMLFKIGKDVEGAGER